MSQTLKVAVIQAAPILFDRTATIQKTCTLIQEAADQQAKLMLFPEAFIPAYPRGLGYGMVVGSRNEDGRKLWQLYWQNAIEVPSLDTDMLGASSNPLDQSG